MDDGEIAHLPLETQFTQPFLVLVGQMFPGPFNRVLGQLVEIARRLDQRRLLVVISFHDRAIHLATRFTHSCGLAL